MEKEKAIGIFDSGIGGLTVLREIRKNFPSENILYLGDTARVPFGTKSRETVLKYTIQDTLFLLDRGVKALVIACNTASAYGLDSVQQYYKVPVLGVIEPGAKGAVARSQNKKIGIIGTEGTIKSGAYQKALTQLDSKVEVVVKACPLLVSLAEEGWHEGEIVRQILDVYLAEFKKKEVDTLILGCTHYPLLKKAISEVLGPKIQIVDSAVETARMLSETLKEMHLENTSGHSGKTHFYSTDDPERMQEIGDRFLGEKIAQVQKVEII